MKKIIIMFLMLTVLFCTIFNVFAVEDDEGQGHTDNVSGTLCNIAFWAGVVDAGFCYDVGIYRCNNYDIYVYKNGEIVASSTATSYATGTNVKNTNYEIVEIPANEGGAGYFQVEIKLIGSAQSSGFTRLGLAWEQP